MDLTALLGWIATVLFTVCYIPQIMKTVRTRTVEGLSFLLLVLQFIGNIIALWYATRIVQPPLQVKGPLQNTLLASLRGVRDVAISHGSANCCG